LTAAKFKFSQNHIEIIELLPAKLVMEGVDYLRAGELVRAARDMLTANCKLIGGNLRIIQELGIDVPTT